MCKATNYSDNYMKVEKSVHFNEEHIQVFPIINRLDITMEEYTASNFTDEEYRKIKRRERMLSRHLAETGSVTELGEDGLGLETRMAKFWRRHRMNECCQCVLLEQHLQRETMGNNPEGLAEIYAEYSAESIELAYHRAHSNSMQVGNENVNTGTSSDNEELVELLSCSSASSIEPIPYSCENSCASLEYENISSDGYIQGHGDPNCIASPNHASGYQLFAYPYPPSAQTWYHSDPNSVNQSYSTSWHPWDQWASYAAAVSSIQRSAQQYWPYVSAR